MSTITPDIGFGVLFKTDGYYIGGSAPHLMETAISFNDSSFAKQARHYYFTGGITINRNKNFSITPNILAKYVAGAPPQLNFNVTGSLQENVWLGVSYRTDDAAGLMFGVNIVDMFGDTWSNKGGKMMIGYALDYNLSGISHIQGLSHEVMVIMNFSIEKDRGAKFGGNRR